MKNKKRNIVFFEQKGIRSNLRGGIIFKSNSMVNLLSHSLFKLLARLYIPIPFSSKIIEKKIGVKGYLEVSVV